jgi:radical SAM superfamily enzyme YgiQ (UPF0313 family)
MKVLLISENRCRENLIPYPLGIAYVAAYAKASGQEVSCLDLMFSADPIADVISRIESFQPEIVGLSIRNIDDQDMRDNVFFMPQVKEISDAVKSRSQAPIILGGAGFSIFPGECLEYLDLRLGIVGEGEQAFVDLISALQSGQDPSNMAGVALRTEGSIKINQPELLPDLGRLPDPDRDLFDIKPYNWKRGQGPPSMPNLQARRGCHLHCIYCSSPSVEGRIIRTRPPAAVADELESLEKRYGCTNAVFADSLFSFPQEYTRELCREIGQRGLSIKWHSNVNPLYCETETLEALRRAGCASLSIGNESACDDMLSALKKGFTKKDVIRSITQAKRMGFYLNCFLLLGGPGENRETVKESVELMDRLDVDNVRVTVGIRIFPGCEMRDIALREGVIQAGQNLLYPTFYLAEEARPWLYDYMRDVCNEREGWFL